MFVYEVVLYRFGKSEMAVVHFFGTCPKPFVTLAPRVLVPDSHILPRRTRGTFRKLGEFSSTSTRNGLGHGLVLRESLCNKEWPKQRPTQHDSHTFNVSCGFGFRHPIYYIASCHHEHHDEYALRMTVVVQTFLSKSKVVDASHYIFYCSELP